MPARAPEELDALIQQAFNQGDLDAAMVHVHQSVADKCTNLNR